MKTATFKKIDLASPVWVPQVNEMCDVTLLGKKARCKIITPGSVVCKIELEGTETLCRITVPTACLSEGTAPSSKLDQLKRCEIVRQISKG